MIINIPDNWLPTSENINALPRPLRDFIMRLHANTDPAGELRRAMIAEMERDALRKMIEEAPEGQIWNSWHYGLQLSECSDEQAVKGLDGSRVKLVVIDE
jgi:hypothetical protein